MLFKTLQKQQLNNMMEVDEYVVLEDGTKTNHIIVKHQMDKLPKANPILSLGYELYDLVCRHDYENYKIRGGRNWVIEGDVDILGRAIERQRRAWEYRAPRIGRPARTREPFRRLTHPGRNKYTGRISTGKNKYKKEANKIINFFSDLLLNKNVLNFA